MRFLPDTLSPTGRLSLVIAPANEIVELVDINHNLGIQMGSNADDVHLGGVLEITLQM